MKINLKKIIAVSILLGATAGLCRYYHFSYIGYINPERVPVENPDSVTFVFRYQRPTVSGIMVFTDKSFYTENADQIKASLTATVIDDETGTLNVIATKKIPLSEFSYKDFSIISLDPIKIPEEGLIIFSFEISDIQEHDNHFQIVEGDVEISDKNESPKLVYTETIQEIIEPAYHKFLQTKPFSGIYLTVVFCIFAAMLTLYILEPTPKKTAKRQTP